MRMQNKTTPRKGVAAVEFAIVAPVIMIGLMGMWEIGRMIQVSHTLMAAAREAGRQAAIGKPATELSDVVTGYLSHAGLPIANVQVAIDSQPTLLTGEDAHIIVVSIPIQDFRWMLAHHFTNPTDRLTVQSTWPRS